MKVKLFSHNDLDGVGAVVVGKHAFGDSLRYECCGYDNIDSEIKAFLLSPECEETDVIFITDISVKDPDVIELINQKAHDKVMLLDHHATAGHLNEYGWAKVRVTEDVNGVTRGSSGTTAFYFYLVEHGLLKETKELREFVEQVRSYDTWSWKNDKPENLTAYNLNMLFSLIGRWKFITRFSKNPEVFFNGTERALLEVEQKRIDYTINTKRKAMISRKLDLTLDSFDVGIVFADNYHSELGNILAEENPDLDFIVLINSGNRLSFRSVDNGIDLGQVAKEFGGGGHASSAGALLSLDMQTKMLKAVFG